MVRAGFQLTTAHTDGELKERKLKTLGVSPRYLMQTLGTEWGRAIDPQIWLKAWLREARAETWAGAKGIVVDDVRFLNEAEFLRREVDATIISIITPEEPPLGDLEAQHASERELTAIAGIADAVVFNPKTQLGYFERKVLEAVG